MTHTPGPGWEVIDQTARALEEFAQNRGRVIEMSDECADAMLGTASMLRCIELSPLQAAAPDLLEALCVIRAAVEPLPPDNILVGACQIADRAIAKAKGEKE